MTQRFRRAWNEANAFYRAEAAAGGHGGNLPNNSPLREYRFHPMRAPGMPAAGEDFLRAARLEVGDLEERLAPLRPPEPEAPPAAVASMERGRVLDLGEGATEPPPAAPRRRVRRMSPREREERDRYQQEVFARSDELYYRALWDDQFSLNVEVRSRGYHVPFIIGHVWEAPEDVAGPRRCRVMVVGKAPGRQERTRRRNFVGESGTLLWETLRRLGVERECRGWYITNVVRFLNPDPQESNSLPAGFVADCMPLLHQELRLVRPDFILCLGGEATTAVLGRGQNLRTTAGLTHSLFVPLARSEGETEAAAPVHQALVLTCTHPAAVLRRPENRDAFERALARFVELVCAGPGQARDPEAGRRHYLVTSCTQLDRVMSLAEDEQRQAGATPAYALDAEWHGKMPFEPNAYLRTVQFSWAEKAAACIVLRRQGGDWTFDGTPDNVRVMLASFLRGTHAGRGLPRIIGHYFTADLPWLVHFGLDFLPEMFQAPRDDAWPGGGMGWEKTYTEGGFDVSVAAHAHKETASFKLEDLATYHTTIERYDVALRRWRREYCRARDLNEDQLEGYGECPDDILEGRRVTLTEFGWLAENSYACCDPDATFRLFEKYNGTPTQVGMLDQDEFGRCCREAFWRSMIALPAALEIHMNGLPVDVAEAERIRRVYAGERDRMIWELRQSIRWPEFNVNSHPQKVELLFGERYHGRRDSEGNPRRLRPAGAVCLGLTPYKSTGKRPRIWVEVQGNGEEDRYTPAVDKESLAVLGADDPQAVEEVRARARVARTLKDISHVAQVCKSVLRAPDEPEETEEPEAAADASAAPAGGRILDLGPEAPAGEGEAGGDQEYSTGLLSYVLSDSRVHTHVSQLKETGRWSTWGPALQNIGKKVEEYLQRCLGSRYPGPLRSIFTAPPGMLLVEADLKGAELFMMAVQAGDRTMIEHCRRANLPKNDPNRYEIHSAVAIEAFQIRMPDGSRPRPVKEGLEAAGCAYLRTAAKPVVFGYAYGMTAATARRRALEEGAAVTLEQAEQLIAGLESSYPELQPYFAACERRPTDPGYVVNCYGRARRFARTTDRQAQGEQRRECRNFGIQGGVADYMNEALDNLMQYRARHGTRPGRWFDILLQVHDAVLFGVLPANLDWLIKDVIPLCMSRGVDIWPCDLDGRVIRDDPEAPYHMDVDVEVGERWGMRITKARCRELGISEDYGR